MVPKKKKAVKKYEGGGKNPYRKKGTKTTHRPGSPAAKALAERKKRAAAKKKARTKSAANKKAFNSTYSKLSKGGKKKK